MEVKRRPWHFKRLDTTYAQRYQQTTKLSILATDKIISLVGKQQRYDIFDDNNNVFGQPMLLLLSLEHNIGSTKLSTSSIRRRSTS